MRLIDIYNLIFSFNLFDFVLGVNYFNNIIYHYYKYLFN
jgi:hypothetical protein